jgi:ATP-dependent protease ClpP protease subunit
MISNAPFSIAGICLGGAVSTGAEVWAVADPKTRVADNANTPDPMQTNFLGNSNIEDIDSVSSKEKKFE